MTGLRRGFRALCAATPPTMSARARQDEDKTISHGTSHGNLRSIYAGREACADRS